MITTRSVVAAAMLALPALAKPEVNVYWGVNGNKRLADVCALPAVDYVSLAFVHESPEGAGSTGYPGTTFGNHCPRVYYTVNGVRSNLLSNCTQIQEDIPKCKKLGKKLILSIGGVFDEVNANYAISTVEKGEEWATFMWKAFGPYDATWTGPRPFDLGDKHNSVDGFDFDVERKFPDQEPWIAMINKLREYFAEAKGKFYITGAPECPLSDGWFKMKQMIARAQFDILFIQFYNNEGCHALTPGFNYDEWTKFLVGTKSARATLFIGLPAYAFGSGYIEHARLPQLLNQYGNRPNFGGVMLWDEYWAENEIEAGTGRDYLQAVQDAINGIPHLPPFPTNSSTSTTSAPTATPTSTCSNPYEVQDDDFCFDVAARYRITVDQIMSLNPSLNKFCDLTAGQTICLPAGATEIPPTPPGVCTRPYTVQPGDWCYKIADENGITYEELRAQNPQLDENCNLLVGDVLCLSRDPVTTTSSSVPTPTAAPICLEKYTVKPMDYCYKIAEEHGISVNQLLNYNPNLSDNCDINPGDVLCVKMGQPPVSTSKPPVITTTSGSGPNPTGVPACGETYEVVSQDYCYKIATEHGLEFDQFIALNPQLNENCDLVPGQIVCVRAAVPTTSSSIRPPWPTNNGTMSCSGHLNSTRTHTTRRPTTLPTMTTTFTTSEVSTTAEPEPTVAPGPECAKKYTVAAGDTCARVAAAHKTTPKKLIEINPDVLTTPCVVKAGDVICIELAAPLKARWSWW